MRRRSGLIFASVALCLGGLVLAKAGAATKTVSASGGSVRFASTVRNANTCAWSTNPKIAGFATTVKCTTGTVARTARFRANTSSTATSYEVTLLVRGKITTVNRWKVTQVGESAPTTTTTINFPETTTTTVISGQCVVGTCRLNFSSPDVDDATAVTVVGVIQNVHCPDPGMCELIPGLQLDAVTVLVDTGPTGMDPGLEALDFSLPLVGGGHGTLDAVTYVSTVPFAMGGLGTQAPNSSFTATIYFDAPSGSNWSSVNYKFDFANIYAFVP